MALTVDEEALGRHTMAEGKNPDWTKGEVHAALRAIDDLMTTPAMRQQVSQAIDAACQFSWSNAQKLQLFWAWAILRATRGRDQ